MAIIVHRIALQVCSISKFPAGVEGREEREESVDAVAHSNKQRIGLTLPCLARAMLLVVMSDLACCAHGYWTNAVH
eukprot:1155448-Pelagomonas_calceolata.AAC.2